MGAGGGEKKLATKALNYNLKPGARPRPEQDVKLLGIGALSLPCPCPAPLAHA